MKSQLIAYCLGATLLVAGIVAPVTAAPVMDGKGSTTAFPLRSRYIDVQVLETEEFAQRFSDVVVVDVRSKYEYDTLRVKDALLMPVTESNFTNDLRKLREQTSKPIVFYCNGKTCHKSYDAVIIAQRARIPNVLCYDAGIADWAKAHPEKTVLLGKSPIRTEDLISHDRFKERLLEPKAFEAKMGPAAIVLDVRERAQRDSALFPFREERIPLEDKSAIDAMIERAKHDKKTLLIYDQVGKQVEWLQYRLESKDLKDYYFMKGGAQGYFDATLGKVSFGSKTDKSDKKIP